MNKNLLKRSSKNTKELNENTLNNEVEEMYQLLLSPKAEWEKRQNCLKKLAEYVTVLGCNSITLVRSMERLSPCFVIQFSDLRSSITKEISNQVNLCAKTLEMDFNFAAEKIISNEGMLKFINNGNKMISEMVHECIINMIEYSKPVKCIPSIITELNSKSGPVRAKVIEYIGQIIKGYSEINVMKHIDCLKTSIKTVLTDANRVARDNAKEAFYELESKYPHEARKVLNCQDPQTRKHVEQLGPNKLSTSVHTLTPNKTTSSFHIKKDATNTKTDAQDQLSKSTVLKENHSAISKKNLLSTPKSPKPPSINNKVDDTYVTTQYDRPPVPLRPYTNKSNSKLNIPRENSNQYEELFSHKRVSSANTKKKPNNETIKSLDANRKPSIDKSSIQLKKSTESKLSNNKFEKKQNEYSQHSLFVKNLVSTSTNTAKDLISIENEQNYDSSTSYESPAKGKYPVNDCNFYAEVRNEDLEFLIENANSKNWATRVHSFNKITEWFNEVDNKFKPQTDIKELLLKQLIKIYIEHLDDSILKVQESCIKSINSVFRVLMTAFYKEIDVLIAKTIKVVANCHDSVTELAYKLFHNISVSFF